MHPYCEVYLVRHGQTEWNVIDKIQGHTNIPLNKEGEKQALELKEKLRPVEFAKAFSSDLSRAVKTAEIVLDEREMPLIQTPILRERYMGSWEGRLTHEMHDWLKEQGLSHELFSKHEYLSHKWTGDVESYGEVYERLHSFLQLHALAHLGSTILILSHGAVIRSLLYHLDSQPELKKYHVSNCAYIKLHVYEDRKISLIELHGIRH